LFLISVVNPGLDPGVHRSSQEFPQGDGWPGQARP
jgi:hypothetical protein